MEGVEQASLLILLDTKLGFWKVSSSCSLLSAPLGRGRVDGNTDFEHNSSGGWIHS